MTEVRRYSAAPLTFTCEHAQTQRSPCPRGSAEPRCGVWPLTHSRSLTRILPKPAFCLGNVDELRPVGGLVSGGSCPSIASAI